MGSDADTLLGEISSSQASVSHVHQKLESYLARIKSLQKAAGTFTASSAKAEGPSLIKVVNLCLKQAGVSKEDDRAAALLHGARHGIGLLRGMQTNLTCSPFDLEKLAQNVVHKLIERGQQIEALAETETMIQKLFGLRFQGKPAHKGKTEAPQQLPLKEATEELLNIARDPKKAANKDECALLLGCIVNMLTFDTQSWKPGSGKQLLALCGRRCLLWLKDLAAADKEMAKRLAGSLYRLSTKAASLVDADLKEDEKKTSSSSRSSEFSAISRGLREVGMAYLLVSNRVQLSELVQQVVKTARFYESKVKNRAELEEFHLFLLSELQPELSSSSSSKDNAAPSSKDVLAAVVDWMISAVNSSVKGAAKGGGEKREGQLFEKFGAVIRGMLKAAPEAGTEGIVTCILDVLRVAFGLRSHEEEAKLDMRALAKRVAAAFGSKQGGGEAAVEWLARLGRSVEVLRTGCSLMAAPQRGAAATAGRGTKEAPVPLLGAPVRELMCEYARWLLQTAGGAEEKLTKAIECLLTSLQMVAAVPIAHEEGGGGAEMELLAQAVEEGGDFARRTAVLSSASLFNLAVVHYNAGRMEAALSPLRMACEVAMGREGKRARSGGVFGQEEGSQMAKRVCMLTYVLHRCGRAEEALAWAASVAAMLVLGGDMVGATKALEEYYVLLGGMEEEVGEEGGGVLVGVLEGKEGKARVQALELELKVGMRAKRPPVKGLARVCGALLESSELSREQDPLRRARMLLEQCKLQRAGAIMRDVAEEGGGAGKGGRGKGGRGKAAAKRDAAQGGESAGGIEEVLALVVAAAKRVEGGEAQEGMTEVCEEMAIALTWKAVVLLDEGWGGLHGAAQAALAALQLWHGYCKAFLRESGEGRGRVAGGRVMEHLQLLADLLALHGQEALSLHAKRCAVALLCHECAVGNGAEEDEGVRCTRSGYLGRLAVEYGLKGYGEMSGMCVRRLLEEAEVDGAGGARVGQRCLLVIARASELVGAGQGGQALKALEEVEGEAREKFAGVKKEQRRGEGVGAEELMSMVVSVRCEAMLQEGDGVGALREGVAALHAQLYPVRHLLKRKAEEPKVVESTGRDGHEEEERAEGGKGGGLEAGRLGGAVRDGGREASGWRVIEQVCERLLRVGELHLKMGLGREALYYLGQGLELGKGCGSVAWRVRFGGMLAELKDLLGQHTDGRECWREAMDLVAEAAEAEAPSLAFLEADRAWLLAQGREWTARTEGWGRVRAELEEAAQRVEKAVRQEGGEGVAVGSCVGVPMSPDSAAVLRGLGVGAGQGESSKGRKGKGAFTVQAAVGEGVGHTEVGRRLQSLRAGLGVRLGEALMREGRREEAVGKLDEALRMVPAGEVWLRAEGLCLMGSLVAEGTRGCEDVESVPMEEDEEEEGGEGMAELAGMTVVQLKAKLAGLGLPQGGKKAELIERIREATAVSKERKTESGAVKGGSRTNVNTRGQDAVGMVKEAWGLLHPNGPPQLIKMCARMLRREGRSTGMDASFLAMASIGVTVRQQLQSGLRERRDKDGGAGGRGDELDAVCEGVKALSVGDKVGGQSSHGEEGMLEAVEMAAGRGAGLEGSVWVRRLQQRLASTWVVVVVQTEGGREGGLGALQVMRIEREGEVKEARLDAGGKERFEEVLEEFETIMTESRKGLEGGGSVSGDEEKKQWWQARMALDKRLGGVLHRLEQDWLGEHAHLFMPLGQGQGGKGEAGHILLVLDESVQQLPWESMACIKAASVSRLPTGALLSYLVDGRPAQREVDSRVGYYVLNPGGDLAHTQAKFEAAFRSQPWDGVVGTAPSEEELARYLSMDGVFVFCGHGAGERYLRGERVRGLRRCAAAVLMGCGSARLRPQGVLEPRGMVLNYMLGGCPLAIGNLWDVSDRDIDRFADCLLRRAVMPVLPPPTEAPSMAEPNKSLNFAEAVDQERSANLVQGVAAARGAVRMKHLIGAAPVCFGIPVACI